MADIIQLLPDHVANQIAAGEVVQRPASVVKELLENAIDAKATNIKLLIKDAGKLLIQVIDNGIGMSQTDARFSFERHATSKIKTAADLFKLNTKGFRGEALASIAAIAHVTLKTKQENQEVGTEIKIEGSTIVSQTVISTPTGTSIAVKNLFYNIPARRKFLKSNTVEMRHIMDEFHRITLAHPNISFVLFNNNKEEFNLKIANLKQRIVALFGKKTNEILVPINEQTDVVTIEGFIAKPEFAKKKRGKQFFFANNRFIKSPYLHHAVANAFETLLPAGFHPTYFLFLSVTPSEIDINIHPTKTEVKFSNEKIIYQILRSTIKHSLGQYNVAPLLDFNRDASLDIPYGFKNKPSNSPTIEVDRSYNPFKDEIATPSKGFSKQHLVKPTQNWETLYNHLDKDVQKIQDIEVNLDTPLNTTLLEEDTANGKTLQLHQKYIVSTIKSGIVYIHQQRAHERILYESFLSNLTISEATSQQLLFPLNLHFSKSEIIQIKQLQPDLEAIGFEFEKIATEAIFIKGLPVGFPTEKTQQIIEELLFNLQQDLPESSFSLLDMMAKSLSKSLAIKVGKSLNNKEQEDILNKLFLCKEPNQSPFGKPTFISINIDEINKKF